jgi:hypothetical protein
MNFFNLGENDDDFIIVQRAFVKSRGVYGIVSDITSNNVMVRLNEDGIKKVESFDVNDVIIR